MMQIVLKDHEVILRKQDELELGQKPDGSPVGQYRSREYEMFKRQINPLAGGKVDLKLTGSTHEKIRIRAIAPGQFELYSTDPKWDGLVAKYGKEVKGVSDVWFLEQQKNKYSFQLVEQLKRISGIQ